MVSLLLLLRSEVLMGLTRSLCREEKKENRVLLRCPEPLRESNDCSGTARRLEEDE